MSADEWPRVLLINMPWANPSLPNLALGLFKSILTDAGIKCDVLYANVLAAQTLGDAELYDQQSVDIGSELIFTPLYYDTDRVNAADRLASRGNASTIGSAPTFARLLELIAQMSGLLDSLVADVAWDRYDVVGFSLTFQQTLASACLARLIKRRYPSLPILVGGASCDGEMGPALLRTFREIDYVAVGEVDRHIVEIVRFICNGGQSTSAPAGLWRRGANDAVQPPSAGLQRNEDLSSLPEPDYSEYFAQLDVSGRGDIRPMLYLEQSRGCWYGQKQPCTFCGLSEMRFRRKSPERCLEELQSLAARYRACDFYLSDNILDYKHFEHVLPALARLRHTSDLDFTMFYEVKSNLKRSQVGLLAAAGVVAVQIGIESFDDHVLSLMRKGTTGIQQIQSLKQLHEVGIRAVWNILYGIPGEEPRDYERMTELVPYVCHLPPPRPGQVAPVLLQRFSQYFQNPDKYGIRHVRPLAIYSEIFPSEEADLAGLACFFDYDYVGHADLPAARQRFFEAIERWRNGYAEDLLTYVRGPDWVRITDRRTDPSAADLVTLRGLQAELFLRCDSIQGRDQIVSFAEGRADRSQVLRFLDVMVERRWMVRSVDGARYLSLPIHRRGRA